ncbi:DNA translocase FtsK 4TM domain-containing protein, partial [Rhodoblastus sp.]|uniref:DNA translocase FtsK n=2 Tax=Rhodoblastus sp. TaxID=1962975 RepID=UPI003F9D99AD
MRATTFGFGELLPDSARDFARRRFQELAGLAVMASTVALGLSLATWSISDPSLNHATDTPAHNLLGAKGAVVADLIMQLIGVSSVVLLAPLGLLGWRIFSHRRVGRPSRYLIYWLVGTFSAAAVASLLPLTDRWPLPTGLGGVIGDALVFLPKGYLSGFGLTLAGLAFLAVAILSLAASLGSGASNHKDEDERAPSMSGAPGLFPAARAPKRSTWLDLLKNAIELGKRAGKGDREIAGGQFDELRSAFEPAAQTAGQGGLRRAADFLAPGTEQFDESIIPARRPKKWDQKGATEFTDRDRANAPYVFPSANLLAQGKKVGGTVNQDSLEQNARLLEGVLEDFSVKGDIVSVFPGPVVTLYEFEPAPGIKSSRVIGLADDIARSMSAVSARVAVAPGRNAIGIELPNPRRETVFLRELLASADFVETRHKLAIALGKTIGGEPVIVDLAKMPHLLVAGTTGSGKSVAINTMILSLLYRLKPQDCRLIMVDPKMLELSVYDGIPHLLTPVVTDPKKAVVA